MPPPKRTRKPSTSKAHPRPSVSPRDKGVTAPSYPTPLCISDLEILPFISSPLFPLIRGASLHPVLTAPTPKVVKLAFRPGSTRKSFSKNTPTTAKHNGR
ncbi:hypothetical protein D6D28_07104 [Aureobasidium pullulans]|uniref:Uncharacterized protein n=1 Tax=Aureobasidium pullulans TaxID=5580 RepID=A0A4V4HZ91_AURPU|nr:hypothetical protein D6D28_07104 [Aureobasidium pullulans]